MKIRSFAAAALLALPASTLLVGCEHKAEDTSQRSVEQRSLERDLDLALSHDSSTTTPAPLNDLPATADSSASPLPALVPPPAAEPERAPPPPAARPRREPQPEPRPQPREEKPQPRPSAPAPAPSGPQYAIRTAAPGQIFAVSFDRSVSAKQDGVGATFTATLSEALVDAEGRTVIPAGATVTGRITSATRGYLGFEFTSVSYAGEHLPIEASVVSGPATHQVNLDSRGERVAKVAAPAAGGAVLGRVIGGRRGAVLGAVVGAAAGAAAANRTADIDTVVEPGATATIRLDGPVSVRRRVDE